MILRSKKINMVKKLLVLLAAVVVFASCKKNFAPLNDNHRTLEGIYSDAGFAEGVLMNAYTRLPTNNLTNGTNTANIGRSFSEVATDDAVTNDKFSPLLNMATGSWSAASNPVDEWNNSYSAILYLNLFLREVDSINWAPLSGKDVRLLFTDRFKGEAYGLRAFFMLNLLQAHAGYSASGELLGVPIITQALEPSSDFSKPRNTFDQCMQQIYADLAEAEKYIPLDYRNIIASELPSKYSFMVVPNDSAVAKGNYNRVFGQANRQRMSGRIAKAIRAKAALLAASPAFNPQGTVTKWENAANYAGEVLTLNGGIGGLDPQGHLFYTNANSSLINLENGVDQREMLWRGNVLSNRSL